MNQDETGLNEALFPNRLNMVFGIKLQAAQKGGTQMVKRSGMTFIGLLVVTMAALLWQMQPGQAQNTAAVVSPVAVVDITSALTGCQENREREAYIASLNDKVRSEMETLDGQVAAIQSELENALEPGSAAYKVKLQEWFDKQALRDSYEKAQTQI